MDDFYYGSTVNTTKLLFGKRGSKFMSKTGSKHYTANFRSSTNYISPYTQTASTSTRRQIQLKSNFKHPSTLKPKTCSLLKRNVYKKAFLATIVNQTSSKLLQKENPILFYCNKFTSNPSEQLFCSNLPKLLERRFKQLIQSSKTSSRIILPPFSIAQTMKDEGYGTVFSERVALIISRRYKNFTRMKFASLLLSVLTYKDKEAALKFCFEVLTDGDVLDCGELCSWYQSEAEPLVRNDLLSVCKMFRACRVSGWDSSKLIDHGKKEDEEKKYLQRHLKWDLKLWGHVCRKFDGRERRRVRTACDTYNKNSLLKDYPRIERISFDIFKTTTFSNKGLPDILFLVIQMIYGVTICDAYCTYLGVKLFRPFCRHESEIVLQKIRCLPYNVLREYR